MERARDSHTAMSCVNSRLSAFNALGYFRFPRQPFFLASHPSSPLERVCEDRGICVPAHAAPSPHARLFFDNSHFGKLLPGNRWKSGR